MNPTETLDRARNARPATADALHRWLRAFTGVSVARAAVCPGHSAPFDLFARQVLDRPALALWLGPRGGGKSFLSALDTHLASRFHPRHETRILGGSLAQSEQIYRALKSAVLDGKGPLGSDADSVDSLLKTEARYRNGSEVSILAASSRSVRGPHVPGLKLDEVDEIDPELREAAMGMSMARHGMPASVLMTSTWHRVGGPMAGLIDAGEAGAFPVGRFCAFEVLERCPDDRSGPNLERCPACPLQPWCHEGIDQHPGRQPKAKRSAGHYAIDALAQKVVGVSRRIFEADYLCKGPRADGVWFKEFDDSLNVSADIAFDPDLPIHLAIDPGVFTAAVFFQVLPGPPRTIHVLGDYLAEEVAAEAVARTLREIARTRFADRLDVVSCDPAAGARSPAGPRVIEQYKAGGLKRLIRWPTYPGSVVDGLAEVEALVKSADGRRGLLVHPSCRNTIHAFGGYTRARRGGQWMDYPEDPNHPHEDLMDSLRGGVMVAVGRRKLEVIG